jgi:DNA replication protein DnaC
MTIHDPSLRAALKTLKLTGMLDTLDARLAQTRDGKLGHLDFLQVLCEDEIARRETAALARRVRRARFEQPNTFEDFDFNVSPKLPAAMLRDLAALRWLDAGESVILYGPVGVGKTHVAQALGHQVARRGGDIRFVKCSRMLADLAGGHADRTIGQRMREYTRPLVLIVDLSRPRNYPELSSAVRGIGCGGGFLAVFGGGNVGVFTDFRGRRAGCRAAGSDRVCRRPVWCGPERVP